MPYGVDKDMGGDNEGNTKWMEDCVSGISGENKRTGQPYTKSEKIAICKAQLKRNKQKNSSIEIIFDPREFSAAVDGDLMDVHNNFMGQCISKMMRSGEAKTSDDAKILCERELEMNDNDTEAAMISLSRKIRTD